MKKNYNLELNILSCLLQKPELMENHKLKDCYFKEYKKLWAFMQVFYEKFKTFDLVLMTSIARDKMKMIYFFEDVIQTEPAPSLFEYYQEELINVYNEKKKERWLINNIYNLANELYVKKIDVDEFTTKFNKLKEDAEKIFANEEGK